MSYYGGGDLPLHNRKRGLISVSQTFDFLDDEEDKYALKGNPCWSLVAGVVFGFVCLVCCWFYVNRHVFAASSNDAVAVVYDESPSTGPVFEFQNDTLVFFIHMPKTGGQTMGTVLNQCFGLARYAQNVSVNNNQRAQAQAQQQAAARQRQQVMQQQQMMQQPQRGQPQQQQRQRGQGQYQQQQFQRGQGQPQRGQGQQPMQRGQQPMQRGQQPQQGQQQRMQQRPMQQQQQRPMHPQQGQQQRPMHPQQGQQQQRPMQQQQHGQMQQQQHGQMQQQQRPMQQQQQRPMQQQQRPMQQQQRPMQQQQRPMQQQQRPMQQQQGVQGQMHAQQHGQMQQQGPPQQRQLLEASPPVAPLSQGQRRWRDRSPAERAALIAAHRQRLAEGAQHAPRDNTRGHGARQQRPPPRASTATHNIGNVRFDLNFAQMSNVLQMARNEEFMHSYFKARRFAIGHCDVSIETMLPPSLNTSFVTVLRHPVARLKSLYYYLSTKMFARLHRQRELIEYIDTLNGVTGAAPRRVVSPASERPEEELLDDHDSKPLPDEPLSSNTASWTPTSAWWADVARVSFNWHGNTSLAGFVRAVAASGMDNYQTRALSGNLPFSHQQGAEQSNEDMLHEAKRRLVEMPWFGITERYNHSLAMFAEVFNRTCTDNVIKRNLTPKFRSRKQTTWDSMIAELESLDIRLFKFADKLFVHRCRTYKTCRHILQDHP